MRVLSFSENGCVRKNNEDSFLVISSAGLYAVADGMGGHQAGEVASSTALHELEKIVPQLAKLEEQTLEKGLTEAFAQANQVIYEASTNQPENAGMGTTLTVLLICNSEVVIAHVGDSRAYLWRDEVLTLLTTDHSLVGELVRLGQISLEEAKKHPQRNVLMRAVGADPSVEVDCQTMGLQTGDVFLLCTDGFSNMISDQELTEEFLEPGAWEERLEKLRQVTLERGAPDNFTALCCIME
ncbi:Stp1/IreP family PP2C-type Ser/Thr phosphatase [Desulfosporosinus sp. BICA1-9]|uniref:Stp1/IreP family PP2C-type Ser/Thr phosphatase n=1 Tax=Desulfosporosinus sp. BICA1-9 TaxID=1531958 RepID=UPI00054B223C|nr:Stp1/IreP family PP2C-type Ser/Thr phosphatase [Desulfosporosinus sp. BICA1-9]KJS48698.1 MAG: protein phosphatase [Peptococcaceae bacterium BRH_c23]KJS90480.1 MAG: protein phosphatase [Desulfosporosinus sp. BICA1-9]HBW38435.1 Stp1/IreP family PP2C-type Ser/Thr phosphatase [Desulfosporosinus sp.]